MISAETLASFYQWSNGMVGTFGYVGLFFVSMVVTAPMVIPIFPLEIIVFLSGGVLNPVLVGISAGLGSSTGELVGYFIGFGGGKIAKKKYKKKIDKLKKLFKKYRGEVIITLIATFPIVPSDVLGLFCGLIHFDVKKFYIFLSIGKIIRYSAIAVAGFYGLPWILNLMGIGL